MNAYSLVRTRAAQLAVQNLSTAQKAGQFFHEKPKNRLTLSIYFPSPAPRRPNPRRHGVEQRADPPMRNALEEALENIKGIGSKLDVLECGLKELRNQYTSSRVLLQRAIDEAQGPHPKKRRVERDKQAAGAAVAVSEPSTAREQVTTAEFAEKPTHAWVYFKHREHPSNTHRIPSCAKAGPCGDECWPRLDFDDEREAEIPLTFTLHATKDAAMGMHEDGGDGGFGRVKLMGDANDNAGKDARFILIWAAPDETKLCEHPDYNSWPVPKRRVRWSMRIASGMHLHGVYTTRSSAEEEMRRVWEKCYACHLFPIEDGDMFILPISKSVPDSSEK